MIRNALVWNGTLPTYFPQSPVRAVHLSWRVGLPLHQSSLRDWAIPQLPHAPGFAVGQFGLFSSFYGAFKAAVSQISPLLAELPGDEAAVAIAKCPQYFRGRRWALLQSNTPPLHTIITSDFDADR